MKLSLHSFSILFFVFFSAFSFAQSNNASFNSVAEHKIKQQIFRMHHFFKKGELKEVADVYDNNAYIIASKDYVIHGKDQIDQYWMSIHNPINLHIETFLLTPNEQKIYESNYWRNLKHKPVDWKEYDLDTKEVIYQLGKTTMTVKHEGKVETTVAEFVILWKKQDNDNYKILVDSYSVN